MRHGIASYVFNGGKSGLSPEEVPAEGGEAVGTYT